MEVLIEQVEWFPGVAGVLERHARALPQPDQLCGPFWAALATGTDVRTCALAAGTRIWPHDLPGSRPAGEPPATSAWPGLPRAGSSGHAGTSARGVGAAVVAASRGALAAVPVTGQWTVPRLAAVLAMLASGLPATPVANLDTAELTGSTDAAGLQRYLDAGDDSGLTPHPWRTGHFAMPAGLLRGRRGTLVAIADTYPSLGHRGIHLQPVERLTGALARRQPGTGGILLAVGAGLADDTAARIQDLGLEARWWDNGTPYPADRL
ncbi:DUF6885 family protein [Polymorphospora lycopeni]|uniref:Uncharacterized protein n=1 Tax=Polymorphospora lycopeni TaxID=3140240 RepID=A0ABV5CXI1_9ACTN